MSGSPMNALDIAVEGMGDMFPDQDYQSLQARIDLFDESIIFTKYKDGQPITSYEVDPIDLTASFSGQPVTTGLLPRNVVTYTKGGNKEDITIVIPAHKRKLTYSKRDELHVVTLPLPTLIFRGYRKNYCIWAIKSDWPAANEPLFRAPLSNVSGDGHICTGDVPFPQPSKGTIWEAANLFLDSIFNNHYDGNKSVMFPADILLAWESLRGEAEYPLDDLVATKTTITEIIGGTK